MFDLDCYVYGFKIESPSFMIIIIIVMQQTFRITDFQALIFYVSFRHNS